MADEIKILKEYIELVVEKIYSIDKKNQFKLNDLKNIESLEDVHKYVDGKLTFIGKGAGRKVYMLNSGKVLKVAIDQFGVEQNEGEKISSQALGDLIPKTYLWDPEYKWIISELVKPLDDNEISYNAFLNKSGIDFDTYAELISNYSFGTSIDKKIKNKYESNDFYQKMLEYEKMGLDISDSMKIEQWGIDSDGNLKYLDPGLSWYK